MNPIQSDKRTFSPLSANPFADLKSARRSEARTPPTKEELGRFATALRTFGASLSASPFPSSSREGASDKSASPPS